MSRVEGNVKGNIFLNFSFLDKENSTWTFGRLVATQKTCTFHEMLKRWEGGGGLNFVLPCEHRGEYYIDFTLICCLWVLFYVCHF